MGHIFNVFILVSVKYYCSSRVETTEYLVILQDRPIDFTNTSKKIRAC